MPYLIELLRRESRRTSPVRLARIALAAVFASVVGVLFLAPLIVRCQYAMLSPGDPVYVSGYGPGGTCIVEEIDGETVIVRTASGERVTVCSDQLQEL